MMHLVFTSVCMVGRHLLFTRQFYKLQLKDLLSRWGATSSITHYALSIQLCMVGSPLLFTRQFYKLQLKDLLSRNEASSQLRMRVKLWRVAGCHEFLASLGKQCDLPSLFYCTLLSDFIF